MAPSADRLFFADCPLIATLGFVLIFAKTFFSCDKLINGHNRKRNDIKDRCKINLYYVLGTTSLAVMADCEGNSDLNVGTLDSIVPEEAQSNYNSNGTDNVNDALKETNKTWEKCQKNLRDRNMYKKTMKMESRRM